MGRRTRFSHYVWWNTDLMQNFRIFIQSTNKFESSLVSILCHGGKFQWIWIVRNEAPKIFRALWKLLDPILALHLSPSTNSLIVNQFLKGYSIAIGDSSLTLLSGYHFVWDVYQQGLCLYGSINRRLKSPSKSSSPPPYSPSLFPPFPSTYPCHLHFTEVS